MLNIQGSKLELEEVYTEEHSDRVGGITISENGMVTICESGEVKIWQ